jgi:acetoin utilization deacetylase AcuC-like enzyme
VSDEGGSRAGELRRTGFIWHERYAWHDTGSGAGPFRAGGWIEPGEPLSENAAPKRRIRNLIDASGLLEALISLSPRAATTDELCRFHTLAYVERIEALSGANGGEVGLGAYVGRGSYEIALLAAGGTLAATEAVLEGRIDNTYALIRPPGHHALANEGMGFCLFNKVVVAAHHARIAGGCERVAIVDWDVHHGNGTQEAFYQDPSVLTISLHQAGSFPFATAGAERIVAGRGVGANLNVEIPPGSGTGAYLYALEQVVEPAVRTFAPDLILVACGFDASGQDAMGRMLLPAAAFGELTRRVVALADATCDGRLVLSHEGGYSPGYTPFCGLRTVEALSGRRTEVEDPLLFGQAPGQTLAPHQAAAIDVAARHLTGIPTR